MCDGYLDFQMGLEMPRFANPQKDGLDLGDLLIEGSRFKDQGL